MIFSLIALISVVGVVAHGMAVDDAAVKAKELLAKMNQTEKVTMLHGKYGTYVGNVAGNERLGIPSLNLNDGPQGFRTNMHTGPDGSTTAWPSTLTIAASWDTDLVYRWGAAMSQEFKGKGANVLLGPGLGMARVPTAGRNFEYLSGEDPYLGAKLAPSLIKGIQDQGVIANAKHWVNNEIEDQRMLVSSNVGERVRFELYYPPFEAAVKAGVLSVMCSYNQINEVYACQNPETLGHLKNELGFEGWVVSDWTATHSTAESLNSGLDLEMPYGLFYNEKTISDALDNGSIDQAAVDDSVYRILKTMLQIGLFDEEPTGDPNADVTSAEHNQLAREIAADSMVLLKNSFAPAALRGGTDTVLPLSLAAFTSILVVGDNSTMSGGGSGHVQAAYTVSPYEGIMNAMAEAGISNVQVTFDDGSNIDAAAKLAGQVDVVLASVATSSTEGSDRDTLSLGEHQDSLVSAVAAANPRTVVAVNTPGACLLPWADEVPALLVGWLPGQEWGNALADVLLGKVNPAGRLTVTMPNKDNEVGFTEEQYPGTGKPPSAVYSEELLIGYRFYDAYDVTPRFPFGHGLSYSSFAYSNLQVASTGAKRGGSRGGSDAVLVEVSVDVQNVGATAGREVVQLYVQFPAAAGEPVQQLRSFSKTAVLQAAASGRVAEGAGGTERVVLQLTERDLSVWDAELHQWTLPAGEYEVRVGASSRDIRLTGKLSL